MLETTTTISTPPLRPKQITVLGPKIRTSEDPAIKVLVIHYSLDFIVYKAASGGVFFRCGIPKDAVYKDYKAKPLVQRSVHPRILQCLFQYFTNIQYSNCDFTFLSNNSNDSCLNSILATYRGHIFFSFIVSVGDRPKNSTTIFQETGKVVEGKTRSWRNQDIIGKSSLLN